jgi:hypothetical protein
MTFVTPGGLIGLIFVAAVLAVLILGVIFSHLLGRYGASSRSISTAQFIYMAGGSILLATGAFALFFFYSY